MIRRSLTSVWNEGKHQSNWPERAKMGWQFSRFDFDQVLFDVFHDLLAYIPRQKIDNVRVDLRRCGEGPAFGFLASQNFRDLIRQLPVYATVVFTQQRLPLGYGVHMSPAHSPVAHRKSPSLIGHLIEQFTMGVGNVEGLHEFQAGPARRRFIYSISFETAAVGDDDKRCRCHRTSVFRGACGAIILQIVFASGPKITRYFCLGGCSVVSPGGLSSGAPCAMWKWRFL